MAILAEPVRRATGARPARRGVNYPLLGLAFVALAIAKLATEYYEMNDRIQDTAFAHEGCTRYKSIMSPEDIIPVFEGVYVASSDERRRHIMKAIGLEASPPGELYAIWNVDTPGKDPSVASLKLEGFPKNTAFHPHGMHFRQETGELFVINHAYAYGGERIDVFKVEATYPQDALPTIDASLEEDTTEAEPGAHKETCQNIPEGETACEKRPNGEPVEDDQSADRSDSATNGKLGGDVQQAGESGTTAIDDGDEQVGAVAPTGKSGGETDGGSSADEPGVAAAEQEPAAATTGPGKEGVAAAAKAGEAGKMTPALEAVERVDDATSATKDKKVVVEESPREKAKRLKQEAKQEAARLKAEAKAARVAEAKAKKAEAARLAARKKGLSSGSVPVKVKYSFSVEHDFIATNFGVLNDLVLVDDDELYVTQYLPAPFGIHGPTDSSNWFSAMKLNVYVLMMLLRVSFAPIIHCTGIRGDGTHCERLAQGRGIMYNGIALSPNKERLIVSDTMGMKMLVFNRDVRTGALTLRQHLDLPGSPDNVEIDVYRAAKGVEAYTVGLVNMWHYMAYTDKMGAATDVSEGDDTRCAGGISSIVYDSETGRYSENLEMWQDGNLLSISVASATASDSRLVGSSMEEGFLVCRPPSCATVGDKGNEHCGWEQPMSVTESNPAVEEAATE